MKIIDHDSSPDERQTGKLPDEPFVYARLKGEVELLQGAPVRQMRQFHAHLDVSALALLKLCLQQLIQDGSGLPHLYTVCPA